MKKSLLFLSAVIVSGSALAQIQMPAEANLTFGQQPKEMLVSNAPQRMSENDSLAAQIIRQQPAGKLVNYAKSAKIYYMMYNGQLQVYFNTAGLISNVVYGENDAVYMKNPVSKYKGVAWMKGTVSGDTLMFPVPQIIDQKTKDGTTANYYLFSYKYSGSTCTLDESAHYFKFVHRGDSIVEVGNNRLGVADEYGTFTGYGDESIILTVNADTNCVVAPANLTAKTYSLQSHNAGITSGVIVNVGFDGNTVYVQGINPDLPKAWIKGTINGDKAFFPHHQYLGIDTVSGYYTYFYASRIDSVYNEKYSEYDENFYQIDGLTFSFDSKAMTFKCDSVMFVNAGRDDIVGLNTYRQPWLVPFEDVAETPADPQVLYYHPYGSVDKNNGYIGFIIFLLDTKGNFMDPEKTSYRIYFDNDMFTFTPDLYTSITSSMTDVPLSKMDEHSFWVFGDRHYVYFYEADMDKVGVQTVYRGGGEVRTSHVMYYGDTSGIANAKDSGLGDGVSYITYTDLSGRTVANPTSGLYIKTVHYKQHPAKSVKTFVR